MARVTGPLHSDGASGTLGKTITFSHWKGARAYVRSCVTPTNPKMPKQVGVRSMFGFCAAAWHALADGVKLTWKPLADATSISEYNAYIKKALANWQTFLFPQQNYDELRDSTALSVTTQTTTGGVGTATIAVTPSGTTNSWGIAIFRGATGFTPSWANCIAVVPTNGVNAVTWVDSPLAAGSYYYRTCVFNTDGVVGTIHAESSVVTVT